MANEYVHHEHSLGWGGLFRIALMVIGFYLIWQLHSVIIIMVLSLMLSSALYPLVRFFNQRLSLTVSAVLVMMLLIIPIIISIAIIIPNFIDQFPGLLATLNIILSRATILPESFRHIDLTQYAENGISYLVNSSSKITGFITTFITILFMTLYVLIDSNRLRRMFFDFIPAEKREQVHRLVKEIYIINGHYIRGNLLISTICGTVISIGLLSLNIPYAIPLGIFAGILDLLPLIGALTGAIPALIIGFALSPTTGFLVLLLFILYQQVENNLLAPNIYNRLLDLSPSLSLLSVLIGATTFGVTGAFVALPIAASIPTLVKFASREHIIKKRASKVYE